MLVIQDATVYPGNGPPRNADVGVADGKIAAVGGELPADGSPMDAHVGGVVR